MLSTIIGILVALIRCKFQGNWYVYINHETDIHGKFISCIERSADAKGMLFGMIVWPMSCHITNI